MCGTCGCGDLNEPVKISKPGEGQHSHDYIHTHEHDHHGDLHQHEHHHSFAHNHPADNPDHVHNYDEQHTHHHNDHHHDHPHDHSHSRQINIEADALQINKLAAARNRGFFEAKGLFTLNLVSSPGSGKTSLLEKTIKTLKDKMHLYVIEGDQQTMNDANRIDAAGAPVVQVNTGNGCHLDADMVNRAVKKLNIKNEGILMIENVGNLVCPSLFDLGETKRVVIISVTEGDDKPLKYPTMFETSDICIINKTDLLPYVDFDVAKTREYALRVNPNLKFFELSVKTEEGMQPWIEWLTNSSGEVQ